MTTSGDSAVGKGTFAMEGGTLKLESGGLFYTTNTESGEAQDRMIPGFFS